MTSKGKRIAWVTGGGSGIGLAGAEALAGDGWTVTISGRRLDALEEAAKRIGDKTPAKVDVLPLDVTRTDDVQAAARSILAKEGQIDLLVNNAGLNVPKRSWKDLEIGGWDQIVDVNLSGVLYAMHAVLPAMRDRKNRKHHQRRIMGRPYRLADDRTRLHGDQACDPGFDAFVQYGRVPQRSQGMLSLAGGSGDAYHEEPPGTAIGRSHVENAPTGGRRTDDCVRGEHASPCLRQRGPDQSGGEPRLLGGLHERRLRLLRSFLKETSVGPPWLTDHEVELMLIHALHSGE